MTADDDWSDWIPWILCAVLAIGILLGGGVGCHATFHSRPTEQADDRR